MVYSFSYLSMAKLEVAMCTGPVNFAENFSIISSEVLKIISSSMVVMTCLFLSNGDLMCCDVKRI